MRFMIKKYRNRIKKWVSESYYVYKRRLNRRWDSYLEKGHEKMTVMFIPHNQKRIFNFQISKFTLSFFLILFVIVISTSTYAIIKNAAIEREEQRLLSDYMDIRSHLLRFEKHTNKIDEMIKNIKPEVSDLYKMTVGDIDIGKVWNSVLSDAGDLNTLEGLNNILPEEIFTLAGLQKDIVSTTNIIKTIKTFVDVRSKVIGDMPSIVPNRGHITSLFGWRRSPFGFGRDFHTGIDIAAPPGTAIRATAPGVVVSAGWGSGYGYLVRIKHKYGFQSMYGHCSKIIVKKGDRVKKGTIIAYVGQTGAATGNHCHYEIRVGHAASNPYPYMSRVW
ncbi:MAG: M23 family metallopeptidase [Spirochaetota bacterium]|nr:M23 family metallopeptidase [Spirochaetota bacterium]